MKGISRTAVYVAASRAVGAREPDPDVRNPDYLAERLLGDVSRYDVELPIMAALDESYEQAMRDYEIASNVRMMMVRTRFIDDALEQAVAAGAKQVLILGAGFDSHAYRFDDLLSGVMVYEVDRPVTLAFKRLRVRQVLGGAPENLRYVAVDFDRENLRELLRVNNYDFGLKTFVIMEGVTMYLAEGSLRETFALLGSHRAGSSIVFDFVSSAMVAGLKKVNLDQVPEAGRVFVKRFLHLIRDEPWQFGFPLNAERETIESFGFDIRDLIMLDGEEAARRYLVKSDGTEVGEATMARRSKIPAHLARAQREAMAYRICEAVVAHRH